MRSALYKFPFVLLLIGVAHCQGPPPQMVNPHTQIRWPLLCNHPGQTYVFQTNTCMQVGPIGNNGDVQLNNGGTWGTAPGLYYDYATNTMHFTNVNISGSSNVIVPPTQVTWPPSCSSGVYVPSSNTCVPPGTAANPAGSSGEAQINMGGSFSSVTGSAPLGASGMQYQGPLQSPNLIGTTNVNAPASIGYKQNTFAPQHNRDQTTAITATPQDACSNAGNGQISDAKCFWDEIRFLSSSNNNAVKRLVVPSTPNGYYFGSNDINAMVILPYDFGDYHGSAGYVTPAAVGVHFTNGQLTGCAITGGSGYTANAQLPIQILDPQHLGSGAAAYVTTNSSGVPASTCVVQLPGISYPQLGTMANVVPIGGDGAAGTCTLSANTFAAAPTCTVSAGGLGYNDGGSTGNRMNVSASMPGLTCASYPLLTVTVSGSTVTGTTTTAGSGCNYTGPSIPTCTTPPCASATVPIAYGASCGGAQCHLLPMETPVSIPCSVPILSNVAIEGVGNPRIVTDYSIQTSNTNPNPTLASPIAFCDPWADQGGAYRVDFNSSQVINATVLPAQGPGPKITGLTINAQIGMWFSGLVQGGDFSRNTFQGGAAFYAFSVVSNSNTRVGPVTKFEDDQFQGVSGLYIGGAWYTRNPGYINGFGSFGFAEGAIGGTLLGPLTGYGTMLSVINGETSGLLVSRPYIAWTTVMNSSSARIAWDTFWEQYVWKTQNRPATPYSDANRSLSNSSTSCLTTLTYNTRATDAQFGYSANFTAFTGYPWFNCFMGVVDGLVQATPSYSSGFNNTLSTNYNVVINDVQSQNEWRPVFMGQVLNVNIQRIYDFQPNVFSDPYLPGGVLTAQIWLLSSGILATGVVADVWNTSLAATPAGLQALYYGQPYNGATGLARSKLRIWNVAGSSDQAVGGQAIGQTTLALGTATVSSTAACNPSATCVYQLNRCKSNASTAVGVPTVGTIVTATSFVINSLSSTNTTVTGDLATLCWRIN